MKKIFFLLFIFSFSLVRAQVKQDTAIVKIKDRISISILGELNYSSDNKISFKKKILNEYPGYSYPFGATVNITLNKYFSIGTGIMQERFSTSYGGFNPYVNAFQTTSYNFFFIGVPIIPDFFYYWKNFSLHFIPEVRADQLTHDVVKDPLGINVEQLYNKKILILVCPKIGVSYHISHSFSLSAYFGIKYTLSPISQTDLNSPWKGLQTSFYSLTGGFAINYKF